MTIPVVSIEQAAEIILSGGVVAYPTEAIYGLGCHPDYPDAVARINELKQRPPDKSFLMVAGMIGHVTRWLHQDRPEQLQKALTTWPGPVTWVFDAMDETPNWLTADDGSIGLRLSDHPTCIALCNTCNSALISTSANPSGQPPAVDVETVQNYFSGQLDAIVNGVLGTNKSPSSIYDARNGAILR